MYNVMMKDYVKGGYIEYKVFAYLFDSCEDGLIIFMKGPQQVACFLVGDLAAIELMKDEQADTA